MRSLCLFLFVYSLFILSRVDCPAQEAEVPIPVKFRARSVGDYFADQLVEDCVIVELKAVEALAPEHQAQVINYLKASDFEVGLLVNFGRPKIEYRRLHK